MYEGSPPTDNTRLSRHMMDSFWALLFLDHGEESRNLGHRSNVASLCGWSRTTSAGRLIAWHVVGCLIWNPFLFVTKKTRLLIISLSIVFARVFLVQYVQTGWSSYPVPLVYRVVLPCFVGEVSSSTADGLMRQGVDSLIILGAWL
jgi:hypothetical protein